MFASVYNASHVFLKNWLFDGFIVRAESNVLTGPFAFKQVILPQTAGRWDENVMNPKIVQANDGTFLLFYTGNIIAERDYDSAQKSQRIGMAYSNSIHGPFTRVPHPVISPRPGKWDSRITTNAAVTIGPGGSIYMVYKASSSPEKQTQVGYWKISC